MKSDFEEESEPAAWCAHQLTLVFEDLNGIRQSLVLIIFYLYQYHTFIYIVRLLCRIRNRELSISISLINCTVDPVENCTYYCHVAVINFVSDNVEYCETRDDLDGDGGLNWQGAFRGGIVDGVTHVLKSTETKTVMLFAFDILFNMIDRRQVLRLFTQINVCFLLL